MIRKRILQLAVAFSTTALDKKESFMLKVLEQLLTSRHVERLGYSAYSDAVKELQADSVYELQRLASKMPDQLLVRNLRSPRKQVLTYIGCLRAAWSESKRDHLIRSIRHKETDLLQYIPLHNNVSSHLPLIRRFWVLIVIVWKPPRSNQTFD